MFENGFDVEYIKASCFGGLMTVRSLLMCVAAIGCAGDPSDTSNSGFTTTEELDTGVDTAADTAVDTSTATSLISVFSCGPPFAPGEACDPTLGLFGEYDGCQRYDAGVSSTTPEDVWLSIDCPQCGIDGERHDFPMPPGSPDEGPFWDDSLYLEPVGEGVPSVASQSTRFRCDMDDTDPEWVTSTLAVHAQAADGTHDCWVMGAAAADYATDRGCTVLW